jgi:hypothetical protein
MTSRLALMLAVLLAAAGCAPDEQVASVAAESKNDRCTVGARRCADGDTPELCVASGGTRTTWVAQADCAGDTPICADGSCVCGEGAGACQGNEARQCSGGVWQTTQTCAGAEPICAGGQCVCQEQSVECLSEGSARRCVAGSWQVETCDFGCVDDFCRASSFAEPGVVACTAQTGLYCSAPTPYCNVTNNFSTFTCGAYLTPTSLECDGPNDCPAGTECCKGDYALCSTRCVAAGTCSANECFAGRPNLVVCDPSAPACPTTMTCQQVEFVDPDILLYACR